MNPNLMQVNGNPRVSLRMRDMLKLIMIYEYGQTDITYGELLSCVCTPGWEAYQSVEEISGFKPICLHSWFKPL